MRKCDIFTNSYIVKGNRWIIIPQTYIVIAQYKLLNIQQLSNLFVIWLLLIISQKVFNTKNKIVKLTHVNFSL